jgi:hypothetical protein
VSVFEVWQCGCGASVVVRSADPEYEENPERGGVSEAGQGDSGNEFAPLSFAPSCVPSIRLRP